MTHRHLSAAALVCGSCLSTWAVDQQAPTPFLRNGVTAHRGNSVEFPENTLPAFAAGIAAGADWLELDVHLTLDGVPVVIHDGTTGRVGDRDLVVGQSTYGELAGVDVAAAFRQRTGATLAACPAERIPRLEEVLNLVMAQERTRVSIQPKMACVAEAMALITRMGATRWVGFNDGNAAYLDEARRLAPEVPLFWDRDAHTDVDADVRFALEHGFGSLVLHHTGITAEKVSKIRAAGLEAGAWTVNERTRLLELLDLGVERIYTDAPGLLLALHAGRRYRAVGCEGVYTHHLQGIAVDGEAIYWSFTTQLVKTGLDGKVLCQVPVANHHGDLCVHAGKVYVAVNLGRFNRPAGEADSWVYVYDAETLAEIARHPVPEAVHGAGGIAWHDGRFIVVGGLPEGVEENTIYAYDDAFRFRRRHVLPSGYTRLGIQTVTHAGGRWWFGCYGNPAALLVADEGFTLLGRHAFDCALGIAGLPDGRFLAAAGRTVKGVGCTGRVRLAVEDPAAGLRLTE